MLRAVTAYARLVRHCSRWHLGGLVLALLASSLTDGVGLLLLVPLLGSLGDARQQIPVIGPWLEDSGIALPLEALLAIFIVLIVLRSAIGFLKDYLSSLVQHKIIDRMRHGCFTALLRSEWLWLSASRQTDFVNLLTSDINRIGVGVNFAIGLATNIVMIVAYLGVATMLSPMASAVTVVSGGLLFVLLGRQHREALNLGHRQGEVARSLQKSIQEGLGGIKLSKILGNEDRHVQQFVAAMDDLRQQQLAFIVSTSRSRALLQAGGAVLLVAYLYAGFMLWDMPLAELLTLVLVFSRLVPMFTSAQQNLHRWLHALPALTFTQDIIERSQAAAEPEGDGSGAPGAISRVLELNNVSLLYPGRERPALDGLSVQFPARTTTAIIGSSGAGKSTLADIVMGLLRPDSGTLEVDGQVIDGSCRRAWRHHIAYVPQDLFLFHDSIRNNLLWACPEANEELMVEALRKAAAEFVLSLPDGLDTVVGDSGLRLSGGERQRIALARAFLKRPCLLILDEATSALDTENEAKIRTAIERIHGDLTVILIGHRLATLEHADQVVLLDEGRVRAISAWDEIRRIKDID